ncbi:Holliday junction branch migration protein RuvA [Bacillus sp. 03113]|uniref:Holliday junction branch migration protein RuvA n=1 Tax=Bacillus sp. 03113 TaxID=2578211 RepID=UPI0011445AE8|nr:Holliday junction branch migration protein RuvA [Bacillus sp. 03113]
MFEFIKGKLDYVCPEYIVLENAGIGYQIATPNPFAYSQQLKQEIQIFIYYYVREDLVALYGFHSREEKNLFTRLLNVSGIGPKGALAILASGEPRPLIEAIENEDEAFLVKFPGVGKKTARQMILDLKGKLSAIVPDYFPDLFSDQEMAVADHQFSLELEEAFLALKALGYSDKEIKRISPELKKEQMTTDQYIKTALQKLLKI